MRFDQAGLTSFAKWAGFLVLLTVGCAQFAKGKLDDGLALVGAAMGLAGVANALTAAHSQVAALREGQDALSDRVSDLHQAVTGAPTPGAPPDRPPGTPPCPPPAPTTERPL